jgi:hypothetical protein
VLGQLGQVVDLLPGEDPLAVGLRLGRGAGGSTGRQEDGVRGEPLVISGAVERLDDDGAGPVETSAPADHPDPLLPEPAGDVVALVVGELQHPGVHAGEVDGHGGHVPGVDGLRRGEVDAELAGAPDLGHQLGGRDQGLAGHAVGQDRRAADAVGVDQGDVGAELCGDERGFVPARPTAEDDDTIGGDGHGLILT